LPSVGAENPVERGQDDIAATRKRVDVPAERVQGNSTHGRRVEEMISAIDLEHWQQIGRFAWEPEIRGRSQWNHDARRQDSDMCALHVEQVRRKAPYIPSSRFSQRSKRAIKMSCSSQAAAHRVRPSKCMLRLSQNCRRPNGELQSPEFLHAHHAHSRAKG
jgi:hypothetical protein